MAAENGDVPTATSEIDRTFHALSDPSRRQFLSRLAEGPLSVTELGAHTNLTLAAVVQHVQLLQASGLITTSKSGRVRTCSLRAEGLSSVETWLADRRRLWERRFDALGEILDQQRSELDGSGQRP